MREFEAVIPATTVPPRGSGARVVPMAPVPAAKFGIELNEGQQAALKEILAAIESGNFHFHLLTGHAGSGKTTLIQVLAGILLERGFAVVVTAPTHKAVEVLARKLLTAGIHVPTITIHSLLNLAPMPRGDRQIFERRKNAPPVLADVVVVDESSMVGEALLGHIRRWLPNTFVLFVGDPAQLPPVGEAASKTFDTPARSHLATVVRQAAGNPILAAAHIIRASQGGPAMDWSWVASANLPPHGVFRPGPAGDQWLRRAFTSSEFKADPDTFRYLCWTNQRVAEVNRKIRVWIYGNDIPMPFMPGERALIRAPIVADGKILFATNEEAGVVTIARDVFRHEFAQRGDLAGWTGIVPSWAVMLRADDGREHLVHAIRDDGAYAAVLARVADEAAIARKRWHELHEFKSGMAQLQAIYVLTVHNSQGSTFRNSFIDIPDIARRASSNVLEAKQLFYVAATRPTHGLFLIEDQTR